MNTHQHIKRILLLGAYVFTGIFSILQAQGIGPDSTQLAAFESFNRGHGYQVYWNTKTGTPEAIFGAKVQNRQRLPGTVGLSSEKVARKFLFQHRDIFKMRANLSDLEISRVRYSKGIAHVRFQQTYKGVSIVGGEYFVHVNETDKGIHMANGRYFPNVQLKNKPDGTVTPAISENVAIETARHGVEIDNVPMDTVVVRLVIYPKDESHYLTWEVLVVPQGKQAEWRVYIDAESGDLLWKENILQHINGTGRVYPTDPRSSYQTKTLYRLYYRGWELEGSYLRAENDDANEAFNKQRTFIYSPSNTHFDEVNVYYHADRFAYDFIGLGYTGLPYQIPAIVHYGVNWDNAGYSPTYHELYFGDGNVIFNDLAKKDDIIYHEYTHAISDDIGLAYSTAGESAAMNEAYSDYFAATFTNDPQIGEWVTIPEPDLRRLDTDKNQWNYDNWDSPDDLYYNSLNHYYRGRHYVRGMIWSGALWDLRGELSNNNLTDELVYGGLEYVNGDATFLQGRAGIIQYDEDFYGAAHKPTIMNVFAARGIGNPWVPPAPPTNLYISGYQGGMPRINWTASTSPDIDYYELWCIEIVGPPFGWQLLSTTSGTWWVDSRVTIDLYGPEDSYGYKARAVNTDGLMSDFSNSDYIQVDESPPWGKPVGPDNTEMAIPETYSLGPNFPNPFNPTTTIRYELPEDSFTELRIYELMGREIRTLVNGNETAGYKNVLWDGKDSFGTPVSSGVYIYRISTKSTEGGGQFSQVRKMILLR